MPTKKRYSEKLKDPRWQKLRLEVLDRDSFSCLLCCDTQTELHVHHEKYHGEPWEADPNELFTLCKHCHLEVEQLKDIISIRELTIMKLSGCDGGTDRVMLIVLVNTTLMNVYNQDDELLTSIELGIREMSYMETAFSLANQRRVKIKDPLSTFEIPTNV